MQHFDHVYNHTAKIFNVIKLSITVYGCFIKNSCKFNNKHLKCIQQNLWLKMSLHNTITHCIIVRYKTIINCLYTAD